jgi:type VI secretion system protein ImpI
LPDNSHASSLLSRLEGLLNQYEEVTGDLLANFEIDAEALKETPDLFGIDREDALVARLETMLARQILFNNGLEGMLREASYAMEPRIVEARVDAEPRKLPWRNDRTYWQAYRQHFEKDGTSLSVRAFFRKAILRTLGMAEEDAAARTEKVNETQ